MFGTRTDYSGKSAVVNDYAFLLSFCDIKARGSSGTSCACVKTICCLLLSIC